MGIGKLQQIVADLNGRLFGGMLPTLFVQVTPDNGHKPLACYFDRWKTIEIQQRATRRPDVGMILAHELCHCANAHEVPPGHGPDWRAEMVRIGITPDAHEVIRGGLFADWRDRQ